MKKETQENLVKKTINAQEQMNALTVDKINKMAPAPEVDDEVPLTMKERAKLEGIQYITPKKSLQAFGKLPEKLKEDHARDWEYVKGMYENYVVSGEPICFWYSKYPGDQDHLWEIPCNKPVYVPRMIAKHLEEVQKYHTFTYVETNANRPDEFTHQFAPTGTHYRGKFRAIGAFS